MLKKSLQLGIVLFFIGSSSFAQWVGSTGTTGNISRDGNVGLGVANPSAKLEISDAGNASLRVGITSNMTNAHAQFINSLAVAGNDVNTVTTNGAVAWDFYNNGNNPTWSGALLEHYGTAVQSGEYGVDTRNMGLLKFQNVSIGVIGSNGANILVSPGGNFSTSFLTNGSVGIGTTNTGSFKLAVEGRIGAREVQVTLSNPFPDYVFASNYKLRSLSSLENYINQNKHLPNIPSAAEVEKNGGVELGKLNTTLLEKVEELTLYIIEINKKVEKLEKENEALKKRN